MPTSGVIDFNYGDNIYECARYHLKFMLAYGEGGWHDPRMAKHKEAFRKLLAARRFFKNLQKEHNG